MVAANGGGAPEGSSRLYGGERKGDADGQSGRAPGAARAALPEREPEPELDPEPGAPSLAGDLSHT
ncbi:Sphingosine-1-Phosphate Phosphatase 2 [Manis pentadactyla]|nr:Sphingosine-1-Phosphate Phosphatase 2 [Manis pentadactyla]